jgi:hypothetical protein
MTTPTKDRLEFTTNLSGKIYTLEFIAHGPYQNVYVKSAREGTTSSIYTISEEEREQLLEWLSLVSAAP